MRSGRIGFLVALMLATWAADAPPVMAACAGPTITAPGLVRIGEVVTISGSAWGDGGCHDAIAMSPGQPPPTFPSPNPAEDIEVSIARGDRTVVVGRADAGDAFGFRTRIVPPEQFTPGPAEFIAASRSESAAASVMIVPPKAESRKTVLIVVAVAVGVLAIGVGVVLIRRRRTSMSVGTPPRPT